MKKKLGTVLSDRYRLDQELGAGGMGSVYLAIDEQLLNRRVVVKIPHAEFLLEPNFLRRFRLEIRSLVELEHPHIVSVIDGGEADGTPFVVLRHLGGGNLQERIDAQGGTETPKQVLEWLPPIAEALDFIHRRGVLHRDVKPGNVLFDADGYAYLADLGIAKVLSDVDLSVSMTASGRMVGSPAYMAPEAGSGAPVGFAYDQYSLAVVIYKALSGRLPFDEEGVGLFVRKLMDPPCELGPLVPDVPPEAVDAVMRGLSRVPQDRFDSCAELAVAFREGLRAPARPAAPAAESVPPPVPPVVSAPSVPPPAPPAAPVEPRPSSSPSATPAEPVAPPAQPGSDESPATPATPVTPATPPTPASPAATATPAAASAPRGSSAPPQRRGTRSQYSPVLDDPADDDAPFSMDRRTEPSWDVPLVSSPQPATTERARSSGNRLLGAAIAIVFIAAAVWGLARLRSPSTPSDGAAVPFPAQGAESGAEPAGADPGADGTAVGPGPSTTADAESTGGATATPRSTGSGDGGATSAPNAASGAGDGGGRDTAGNAAAAVGAVEDLEESIGAAVAVGDWEAAGDRVAELRDLDPRRASTWQTRVERAIAAQRARLAEDRALEEANRVVFALVDRIESALRGEQWSEAEPSIDELERLRPTDGRVIDWRRRVREGRRAMRLEELLAGAPASVADLGRLGCDDSEDCARTGDEYFTGRGGRTASLGLAAVYWDVACLTGSVSGCYNLAGLYLDGDGVPVDEARALDLYDLACDRGNAFGCFNLGTLYQQGRGTAADATLAAEAFDKACAGDNSSGCNSLGILYAEGRGVAQDEGRAAELYQRACDGGTTVACGNLGFLVEHGRGVPQDLARAIDLYRQACRGGSRNACQQLQRLGVEQGR